MDSTFVQAVEHALREPRVLPVEGRDRLVMPPGWVDSTPKLAEIVSLTVNTLSGLVHYVKTDVDELVPETLLVHVKDHATVELRTKLENEERKFRRHTYLTATTALVGAAPLAFGHFIDAEQFFIALQTGFVATEQRNIMLELIASIRENAVRDTIDDGVAQEVKTSKGVAIMAPTRVPNPVTLQPYRTFREIEQPASSFVFRMRPAQNGDRPACALFEADGGAWKLEAIERIAAYLGEALGPDVAVLA